MEDPTQQQITTPEELAALPVGSVVLHNGRAFQHYPAYPSPFDEYQQWKCGDGGFVRSTKDGSSILPATVLHVGDAELDEECAFEDDDWNAVDQ